MSAELSQRRDRELDALIPNNTRRQEILSMGYEALLSLIGVGRYHHFVIAACALSNAADAVEIVAISFVISAGKSDLGMSDLDEGILTAIIFLGMMVGGWTWGSMADQAQFGRRKILVYSLAINAVFGLLSATAVNFYMLLALRFCSGVGVGGSIPVTFTYAAEFLPKEKRGFYLAMLAVSWPFAATFTALLAYAIIPNVATLSLGALTVESWRLFLIPCSAPAFAAAFVFYQFMAASPKWLIYAKGDFAKASQILTDIYATNHKDNMEAFDAELFDPDTLREWVAKDNSDSDSDSLLKGQLGNVQNKKGSTQISLQKRSVGSDVDVDADVEIDTDGDRQNSIEVALAMSAKSKSAQRSSTVSSSLRRVWQKTKLLFSRQHRRSHVLAAAVWFTLSFAFYGLAEWLPSYFGNMSDIDEYTSSIAVSAAQFPGALLTCWLLDVCCDRKTTLALSIGLGALSISGIPWLHNGTQIVALTCVFNGITVCAWSALDVLSTELSPTEIRSTAYGFFSAMGRVGAIAGNLTFGAFGGDDIASALTICGVVLVAGTGCCLLLPSTKDVAIR